MLVAAGQQALRLERGGSLSQTVPAEAMAINSVPMKTTRMTVRPCTSTVRSNLGAESAIGPIDTAICALAEPEKQLLQTVTRRFRLSARSIHRILKVARTIADLDHSDTIQGPHLQEAVGYRCLDKQAVHD